MPPKQASAYGPASGVGVVERERRVRELYHRIANPIPPTLPLVFDQDLAPRFLARTRFDVDRAEAVVRRHLARPPTAPLVLPDVPGTGADAPSQEGLDGSNRSEDFGPPQGDATITNAPGGEQACKDEDEEVNQPTEVSERAETEAAQANSGTDKVANPTQADPTITITNNGQGSQSANGEDSEEDYWPEDYEPPWTPEHGGYRKVVNPDVLYKNRYYWRRPDSFWDGPLKFVRPEQHDTLEYGYNYEHVTASSVARSTLHEINNTPLEWNLHFKAFINLS